MSDPNPPLAPPPSAAGPIDRDELIGTIGMLRCVIKAMALHAGGRVVVPSESVNRAALCALEIIPQGDEKSGVVYVQAYQIREAPKSEEAHVSV